MGIANTPTREHTTTIVPPIVRILSSPIDEDFSETSLNYRLLQRNKYRRHRDLRKTEVFKQRKSLLIPIHLLILCGSRASSAALPRLKPLPNRFFQRSVRVRILLALLPMRPEGCSNNSTLKSTSVREAFSRTVLGSHDFLLKQVHSYRIETARDDCFPAEMLSLEQLAGFCHGSGSCQETLKDCELGCLLSRAAVLFSDLSLHENSLVFNAGFQIWKQWFLVSGLGDTSA